MGCRSIHRFHDTGIHYERFLVNGCRVMKTGCAHRIFVAIPESDLGIQHLSCSTLVRKIWRQRRGAVCVWPPFAPALWRVSGQPGNCHKSQPGTPEAGGGGTRPIVLSFGVK